MEEVVKCPVCRKRIFDLEWQGQTIVKIKCIHCRNVVVVKRDPGKKSFKQSFEIS